LKEESQAVFGNINVDEIQDSMTFYTNNMMIIFVKRQVKMQQITQSFREKMLQKISEDKTIEVKDITWIEK